MSQLFLNITFKDLTNPLKREGRGEYSMIWMFLSHHKEVMLSAKKDYLE